jgi:peptide/nickel transport system substrate-binding protein
VATLGSAAGRLTGPTGGNVRHSLRPRRTLTLLVLLLTLVLVAAACGGGGSDSKSSDNGNASSGDEGKPTPGGTLTYGLEGKTTDFCLPSAQLAISGIMVVEAVYDTLSTPTQDPNVYAPYLAKTIEPNADYTQWTITLRDGIKFQDGEPLNAAAVKQNIDAWRKGTLLQFVYQNIKDTATPDDMTVVVTMNTPWVAFPAYLWSTGRVGIAAPAQLADAEKCKTNMIGTGPFAVTKFDPSTGDVTTKKNPDYWRKGFPYLDGLNFKIQESGDQRVNGLQGGQFDIIHDDNGVNYDTVKGFGSGFTTLLEPPGRREIGHGLLNVTRPPLDDVNIRKAIAMGTDRDALNQIANKGNFELTNSVFDKDVMGYVSDPGYPKYNVDGAKKLVSDWKQAHGGKNPTFALQSTFDEQTKALAQEVKRQMAQIGITVTLPAPVDQATIINQAIGSQVDAFLWRNYPGADPDTMYVWFHSGSPVNFNHINDPQVDKDLDQGRAEPDESARKPLYEDFNKRLSSQAYNLWTWYENWYIASKSNVKGVLGPNLPDASGNPGSDKPVDVLAGFHQLLGLWVQK